MKKSTKKITRAEFNAEYAAVAEAIKEVKAILRTAATKIRPVAKRAWKLYEQADRSFYVRADTKTGRRPAPMFKGLPRKMNTLDVWCNIDLDIAQFVREI